MTTKTFDIQRLPRPLTSYGPTSVVPDPGPLLLLLSLLFLLLFLLLSVMVVVIWGTGIPGPLLFLLLALFVLASFSTAMVSAVGVVRL